MTGASGICPRTPVLSNPTSLLLQRPKNLPPPPKPHSKQLMPHPLPLRFPHSLHPRGRDMPSMTRPSLKGHSRECSEHLRTGTLRSPHPVVHVRFRTWHEGSECAALFRPYFLEGLRRRPTWDTQLRERSTRFGGEEEGGVRRVLHRVHRVLR
ncbi:hypothetical protein DACRYDRAFT_24955 [Dacryopinax primogenitus]|uniref:Uncharacterized protein n=1 Tax=Dacryopinax primogenitus (strain DJM 731) TaxID=1858805 RepID=M5FRF9_DACPD|nr:uncharacterized protein DACRYDRAFT_24955 [Dacryopinax primogenitus]EJT97569.1 hypothetical protein DACRYDRAFT_24955 [Dacryopinax primogenitus]